jgi:hypothetical protein
VPGDDDAVDQQHAQLFAVRREHEELERLIERRYWRTQRSEEAVT